MSTTIRLSDAAQANVDETGTDPSVDVARVQNGLTREALLLECIDGADDDRLLGWSEYVEAVVAAANA